MNSNTQTNFHIIRSPLKKRREVMPTLEINCEWLTDPAAWNKEKFTSDIATFILHTQGVNAYPNTVLIGMLAQQIDLYVQCTLKMAQTGLVEVYNNGVTPGQVFTFQWRTRL